MTTLNRRRLMTLLGAGTVMAALPRIGLSGQPTPTRVVIVGGGFGGATAARYLRLWGGDKVSVTLVDANPGHYSCILSNLVVTGAMTLDQITLGFDALQANHGVQIVQGLATTVNAAARTVRVRTATGDFDLPYDKLILSPGVDFIAPAGSYDPTLTPHAWVAGPQTELLRAQIAKLKKGQVFVMNIPKAPYRCPPGPYERACVIADIMLRKKLKGKVIVLDANPGITAEPVNFGNAFSKTFKGIVDYRPNTIITSINSAARSVTTSRGTVKGDVLNYLPDMKAGAIVAEAGLLDAGGRWAVVDPLTYASLKNPDIHVLGDSQATAQPKSGTMANAQAKVCADAILRAIGGNAPDPQPMTTSACYSPITSKSASWLTASYLYDPATRQMKRIEPSFGEAPKPDAENYIDMFRWANSLFADTFG
jgi:NADPH-dependent 2,4-dienoyl-CoA reductase/sulfur reductase-like enzyme